MAAHLITGYLLNFTYNMDCIMISAWEFYQVHDMPGAAYFVIIFLEI